MAGLHSSTSALQHSRTLSLRFSYKTLFPKADTHSLPFKTLLVSLVHLWLFGVDATNLPVLFCLWFGVLLAQLYGHLANDRLPLWLCRRSGGIWQPEYRLQTLWLPGFVILPIGLGIFGASLQYHLHYMVLALGSFLIGWSTTAIIPVTVNYIIECFNQHASEAAAIMGLYRLAFSLTLPFFVPAWIASVGANWCLGMAAFFSIFAYSFIIILIWKGHVIRRWSFKSVARGEEGLNIMGTGDVPYGNGSPA